MTALYRITAFHELTNTLLYDILALRAEVFVVEQASLYLDLDGLDADTLHLCLLENEKLIGYSRLAAPGVKFEEASIGRILLAMPHRGNGMGRKLIERSIAEIYNQFGNVFIRIEAQYYLRDFYASLGFTIASDIYDWGGIEHVKMVKKQIPAPDLRGAGIQS